MPPINAAYLEHQLKRWMRPDAHHFVRADWRKFARPGSEDGHPFALYERKYRPDQPRVPAGSREGGQWTDEDETEHESGGLSNDDDDRIPTAAKPTAFSGKRGHGHHYVASAEVRNRGISKEATEVFDRAKTGPLLDTNSNKYDTEHRAYNKAVGEALDLYLAEQKISPESMTADQAHEFVRRVLDSADVRIKHFNLSIHIREIAYRLRRRIGRE